MQKKIEVEILKDQSEAVPYDAQGIPLYIRTRNLSDYVNMRSFPHWHDEIEMMYIEKGRLQFHVNGRDIPLRAGDCIMVNVRQMHHSSSFHHEDCTFFCLIFHPRLLTGNTVLYNRLVLPVLENADFESRLFRPRDPFYGEVSRLVKNVNACRQQAFTGYEIAVTGHLNLFWAAFLREYPLLDSPASDTVHPELKIQQDMLSFIHQHYGEKLTLDDIASAGHVCRSKCCAIFRQYMNTSPMDFLNQYRLEISCHLLAGKASSITEIALSCGFSHNSYFSQLFRRTYGCSPREYQGQFFFSAPYASSSDT